MSFGFNDALIKSDDKNVPEKPIAVFDGFVNEPETFKELFSRKRQSNYDVEFSRNPKGLRNYIKQKELYGRKKQRTFGKSFEFRKAN